MGEKAKRTNCSVNKRTATKEEEGEERKELLIFALITYMLSAEFVGREWWRFTEPENQDEKEKMYRLIAALFSQPVSSARNMLGGARVCGPT